MSAIEAVVAVIAVEEGAKKRIDFPQRSGVTYYSENDIWLFDARSDTKVCNRCRMYQRWSDVMGGIRGNLLRTEFPYHVILDEITIGGPEPDGGGLVHPNCRCVLKRLMGKVPKV